MPMNRLLAVSFALLVCLPAVPLPALEAGAPAVPPPAVSRPSPAVFTNVTVSAGLGGLLADSYAWGDYDNDGCEDLLVKGRRLFRNSGPPGYTFSDVSKAAGLGSAYGYSVWGDYNNDGYLDFFCCGQDESQRDSLWRNNGPPGWNFTNVSVAAGGMDDGLRPSLAPAWTDYDRDGFLDIYVMNWRDAAGTCYADVLWRNNRDGTFAQTTAAAGIVDRNPVTGRPNAGMGVGCADYNNDGWPDIYAGNYLLGQNDLWHNDHDGTFTNLGDETNTSGDPDHYPLDGSGPYYGHTAGSCWGDYDNDGLLDLWVGNLAHKDTGSTQRAVICDNPMLLRNLGFPYVFEDYKERAGMPNIPDGTVQESQWRDDDTFGGAWCDFDNDGWLDLYVPEVKGYHSWAYSHLWRNDGDGTFTDVGLDAGIRVWAGIGCAWADYNNDGQPDHITEGTYPYQGPRECHLFKNEGTKNHWLKVHLSGTVSNRAGIGARVTVTDGARAQIREVEGGTGGHAHQNSLTQMFGFGAYTGTVTVEIRWPSGIVQNITGVLLDQTINVVEDGSGPKILSLTSTGQTPAEGEEVTLAATFTGSPSRFLWDLEGDGRFDLVRNSYQPVTVSMPRPGRFYPSLKVMDAAGKLGDWESLYIVATDVPPTANAGGDRTANETEPTTFDGSASTGAACDVPNLTYKWTFNDGWTTGWQPSPLAVRSFNQSGAYSATLSVRDDENGTSNDTIAVTVLNLPPTVAISMGDLAVEDTPLQFDGSGSDTGPDRPFLRYQWDFGDGTERSPVLVGPGWKHTYTRSGVYGATLTVTDDDKATASASIDITVANLPPSGTVEFPSVRTDEDSPLTLTGTGTDTPSDIGTLAFRWDLGDGNTTDWMPDPTTVHTYTRSGNYTAVLFVRDNDGATANATMDVSVRNLPPTCTATTGDQRADEDAEVLFDGTGRDTPTDARSLLYRWDFGDGNQSGWSPEAPASHSYAQQGLYRGALVVRDDDGAESRAGFEVTVDNLPPVARAKASRTTVDEDTPVVFNASGSSDTPSDLGSLSFSWDFGDGKAGRGPAAEHSYTKQRTYSVVLTVTDNDGATSTAELTVRASNVAPTVNVSADRARGPVGTRFNFSAEARDTESDIRTMKYEWRFGDLSTGTGQNTSRVYEAPGNYTVSVKVTDDEGASAEASLTVEVYKEAGPPAPAGEEPPVALIAVGAAAAVLAAVVTSRLMAKRGGRAVREQAEADQAER
ncbi:MAG: PKD domain-containing protein [Euryarchaeota archaeon]|nr:PKD domain-containing protein [Euryarchaeota archaeon]